MASKKKKLVYLKPIVFLVCLLPFIWLGFSFLTGGLGVNPIESLLRELGDWALRFLLLGLAISPLRRITGIAEFMRYRRMIGLYGFFYAVLHLLVYVVFDHFFDWSTIWTDIVKRPYITIGMAAILMLIPLAITSTKSMIRKVGGQRWKKLHWLVFPIGFAGVVHFLLLVKADVREPLIYGAIFLFLIGERYYRAKIA